MLSWLKRRRRRNLLAQPFPAEWREILQANCGHFAYLPQALGQRLLDLTRIFVSEKHWEGCEGLEITDEIRVTIASQACLLLLGIEGDYCFDGVRTILVYPGAFARPAEPDEDDGLVDVHAEAMTGEAWRRGPVILSWRHALEGGRDPRDGENVVLHEFAHQLDALDGDLGGTPPLPSRQEYVRWRQVMDSEHEQLRRRARTGRPGLLDEYGGKNRAELFAVSTECFFERPLEMRREHPGLYALLKDFYHLDPAKWFENAGSPDSP